MRTGLNRCPVAAHGGNKLGTPFVYRRPFARTGYQSLLALSLLGPTPCCRMLIATPKAPHCGMKTFSD